MAVEQFTDSFIKSVSTRLDRIILVETPAILDKLDWQLDRNRKGQNGHRQNIFLLEDQIAGQLRGEFGEVLSNFMSVGDCETVYTTVDTDQFTSVSFRDLYDKGKKADILQYVAHRSVSRDIPEYILETLYEDNKDLQSQVKEAENMIEDLSYGLGGIGGTLYTGTVIPDGALVDVSGELVGLVEVKAYKPNKFQRLVRNLYTNGNDLYNGFGNRLGLNLEKEIEFIDTIRTLGFNQKRLGDNMPVLIRFPEDAPNQELQQYGKYIRGLNYPHIIIQKLPLSSIELDIKGTEFLRENIETIRKFRSSRNRYFKYHEVKAMENIAFGLTG